MKVEAVGTLPQSGDIEAELAAARPPLLASLKKWVRRQPLGTLSAVLVVLLIFVALFAPQIAPHDPVANHYEAMELAPSAGPGSEPISSGAISCRVSSGARAPRSSSASPPRFWGRSPVWYWA